MPLYLGWGGEEHYSLNEVESLKSETQDLEKQSGTQCWDWVATKQLASSRSASIWFGLTVRVTLTSPDFFMYIHKAEH